MKVSAHKSLMRGVSFARSRRGNSSIEIVLSTMIILFFVAFAVHTLPILSVKTSLEYYANQLVRTASIVGRVGAETDARAEILSEASGLSPKILWNCNFIDGTDRVQLDGDIGLELEVQQDVGLFGDFASFPITLRSKVAGRSEVYWR